MFHLNMILLTFPVVLSMIVGVVSEIDLLADPGIINLDHGSLTYDSIINDIDLLKEANYDALTDDELIASVEGLVDDNVDYGDVTVDGDTTSTTSSSSSSLELSLPGDDVSTDVVDGEGPRAPEPGAATTTTTTVKNVQTAAPTPTTDPRLERFAEQLELITLPPDKRKRRKIELQLQKISVQNTEEQERRKEERKQRRQEKREKKKLRKLEKMKDRGKIKSQEMNKENKKNDVIDLLQEIENEDSLESFKIIEDNNWVNKKLKSFNIAKEKSASKENKLDSREIEKLRNSEEQKQMKDQQNLEHIEKLNKEKKRKEIEKQWKSEERKQKEEQQNLESIEKRKAKQLRKGKERNLRILQRMIEKEEKRLPMMTKSKKRSSHSRKEERNKGDYQRRKRDLKTWKNMKEKLHKRKKEIRFLLRLKRGFGAKLDKKHKKEVALKLTKLKRKYSSSKEKVKNFEKNNWELIEESKLHSKLNRFKKKISYLTTKKKKYANTPNSNYNTKLIKRINYFRNKYEETKKNIGLMDEFEAEFQNSKSKNGKTNSHGYNLKRQKLISKIKALRDIEKQIDNDSDSEYKLKLNEKIKVLVEKYKKYKRMDKIRNETKKEKKARRLKEKIKRLNEKRKKCVDLVTETKLVKVRDELIKRYKSLRVITGYERRNKCFLRGDHDSKNALRMHNIKEAIESLKNKRKQMKSKIDPRQRTKITETIKRLAKSYRNIKKLEKIKNETKNERKIRLLRGEILSIMKVKKQSKDQNTKIDLTKKITKLKEKYKKMRKIIKYENKYECKHFGKHKKIKERITLLRVKRRQIDKYADPNANLRLTNMIKHLYKMLAKYKKYERERNESENERELRKLRGEIKSNIKVLRTSDNLNVKAKLVTHVKKLREKYKGLHLKVKYEGRNIIEVPKSYEKRIISKYYLRMENLKNKIKSLVKMKKQIRNEVDPRYKLKLNESIKKLKDMYKKYKRLDKMKTETKKEKKSRKLKEKLRYLKTRISKTTNPKSKERLFRIINGLTERYKKVHNQVSYEKRNKCYLRYDFSNRKYMIIEKLKDNIRSLIKEKRALGSNGDPRQRIILKREIQRLRNKYKEYKRKVKVTHETKNENKNKDLKEKIKELIQLKKSTEDENAKICLSKKIKLLVKRYKRMRKIIRYENEYECRYYNRVQQLKYKVKDLLKIRKQMKGDNNTQQRVIISRKITKLMDKYRKYNEKEKTRKQTENGRKMRKLKDEIKSLVVLRKNTDDLNKKAEISKKILTLKPVYKNLRLIVKYEENDIWQISRSYENRIKSRSYNKMQKLKSKIISLEREKREINNTEDSEYKLKLRKKVKGLIKRYKNYKRFIRKKYNRKSTSSRVKQLARRKKEIQEGRKRISQKEDIVARKRQQKKLRLRRRKERRARRNKRRPEKSSKKRVKVSEVHGSDPVLPEGMAYCKSQESKSGGSCQCWYLQDQLKI